MKKLLVLAVCAIATFPIVAVTLSKSSQVANAEDKTATRSDAKSNEEVPTLEVARDRAKVMHDIYAATLEVLHERYFHSPRAMVPARAMQDVFSTIKRESQVEARWIAVNLKPMSIDHAPESEFEKRAAKEIAAGKSYFEAVDGGYYRRAGAIPLSNGCIGCHGGFLQQPSKKPKFAGLVISVPIRDSHPVESQ